MKKEISSAYPFEQKVMWCFTATAFLSEQKVMWQFAATQLPYWAKFHEMTHSHSTALLGKKSCNKLVPLNCLIEQKVMQLLQHKAKCPQRAAGIKTQEVCNLSIPLIPQITLYKIQYLSNRDKISITGKLLKSRF